MQLRAGTSKGDEELERAGRIVASTARTANVPGRGESQCDRSERNGMGNEGFEPPTCRV